MHHRKNPDGSFPFCEKVAIIIRNDTWKYQEAQRENLKAGRKKDLSA